MIFYCLVARSRTRAAIPAQYEADDAACAAFAAWCDMPGATDRPHVRPIDASRWIVSDGHATVTVQILEAINHA